MYKLLGQAHISSKEQPKMTARMENPSFEICPYCKEKMQIVKAQGKDVYLCMNDRAVSPIPTVAETE